MNEDFNEAEFLEALAEAEALTDAINQAAEDYNNG